MTDLNDYRFTETHEWVHLREDGLFYVGITDHAQEEITDIVFVDLPESGRVVNAGDELLLVDSVKASFSIYAPVSGTVERSNEALANSPELVNSSPYEDGWLVALKPSDTADTDSLMTHDQYLAFVESQQ
ncbi:MAG: glycine cleavage system protein GcvH [Armatimonadetes bacterium]|nr:glycine cleavage system protein GcvH [Armatimonadota bacterium]